MRQQGCYPKVRLNTYEATRQHKSGYSTIELTLLGAVLLVLATSAFPTSMNALRVYKLSGAARSIAGQLALVRLRASADFTQARLNVNLTAGTYQIEVCTTKNTATGGCTTFTMEGGTQYLPNGISFSFGSITTAASPQTTIAQTVPILFNSRGIPVDSTLNPTSNNALYVTDGKGNYYAVTVSVSGRTLMYRYINGGWTRI